MGLHSSRLGLSDQREIAPAVYSSRASSLLQLATRSIRSARDCASCVQLARFSSYSSRLGLSDQREIAPVVYSSLRRCRPSRWPASVVLPGLQGSSDGAV